MVLQIVFQKYNGYIPVNKSSTIETVLLINPIASPAYLYEKFKKAGLFVLTCFTNKNIDYLIQPIIKNNLFDEILFLTKQFTDDQQSIRTIINSKQLNIQLAIAGSEYDLPYAEQIAHCFCSDYTNNPATAIWRCNKRLMNERLQANATYAAQQIPITDSQDVDYNQFLFPVVVKPAEGSGASMGVAICNTPQEVSTYFDALHTQKWAHCYVPNEFLMEELLVGDEYIIDMVAWNGVFHLVGIYYAQKELFGSHKICRHREFLNHENPIAQELFDYCSQVLHNLDVRYGMMHLECMYTKNGPVLIELNPRVSGVSGTLNYFAEAMIGYDQASLLIQLLKTNGQHVPKPPAIKKHGVVFYLQNFGFTYNQINEGLFRDVPSYLWHLVKIPKQTMPSYPSNLLDTVAFVILVNDSEEQLRTDLAALKALETEGKFFESE